MVILRDPRPATPRGYRVAVPHAALVVPALAATAFVPAATSIAPSTLATGVSATVSPQGTPLHRKLKRAVMQYGVRRVTLMPEPPPYLLRRCVAGATTTAPAVAAICQQATATSTQQRSRHAAAPPARHRDDG